jgi:hypothetical protein
MRDWICDSAWISISRTWLRSRITLPVSSSRLLLSERSSPSTRARAIATSPASFESRSITSARTRSIARAADSVSAGSAAAPAPIDAAGASGTTAGAWTGAGAIGAGVVTTATGATAGALSGASGRRRRGGGTRLHDPRKLQVGLAGAQPVEQERDVVEVRVERLEQHRRRGRRLIAEHQPRFHPVRELAEAHRAGHARAALERVQHPAQLAGRVFRLRRAPPRAQLLARLREQLAGLVDEDAEHLVLDHVAHAVERVDDLARQRDVGLGHDFYRGGSRRLDVGPDDVRHGDERRRVGLGEFRDRRDIRRTVGVRRERRVGLDVESAHAGEAVPQRLELVVRARGLLGIDRIEGFARLDAHR